MTANDIIKMAAIVDKSTIRAIIILSNIDTKQKVESISISWKQCGEYAGEIIMPVIEIRYRSI